MGMRKRILLATGVTFAGLVLILYLVSRAILIESLGELEKQYVRRDVQRAQSAISDELATMDTLLFDWAAWDDTYTFIEDANQEYIESNLADETFIRANLNLILLVNSSGQIVFGKSLDLDEEEEIPIPRSLQEYLTEDALLRHPDEESSIEGIVLLPMGPMLVVSRPILTSQKKGPMRGTMIMGRYLDDAEIERLAQVTHLSLGAYRLDDEWMPDDFRKARTSLLTSAFSSRETFFVRPLNAELVAGYTLLQDIYDRPAVMLRVDVPRDIYRRGQASMLYLVFLLLVGGLAFTGMSSLVMDKMVVSRLIRLNAAVNHIGVSGDMAARVSMPGNDELSDLSGAINGMLTALERSLHELRVGEKALEQRNRELSTLYEAVTAISSDLSLETVLNTVARQMAWAIDSSRCALSLWNREQDLIETLIDYNAHRPDETETGGATCALADYPATRRVLETGQPVVIQYDDPAADEAELALMKECGAYTSLMLPLMARDRVSGLVKLIDDVKKRDYTPEEIRQAESLTAHAAVAIENAQLYKRAQQEIAERKLMQDRLTTIYILGRELVLSRDEQQIAQTTIDAARLLLQSQLCGLWLVDEEERSLVRRACTPAARTAGIAALPLDGERGITVFVARRGTPIYLPDTRADPRYIETGLDIRSELCVPLKVEERIIGVLDVESEKVNAFDENDRRLISTLAVQAALAIENARLYGAVTQQREQLRALSTRLAEAEEAERERLARELHDRVGQTLTALGINLNIIRAQMPGETAELARARVDDSLALVEQTTECIRNVMADLRPPVLNDYGLVTALRWYSSQFASRVNIEIAVTGEEPTPRLAAQIENGLFRIAQEALTNVARHAQATRVTVALESDEEIVRLTVADDGIGFDPANVAGHDEQRGWGLLTMAERSEAMGGHFHVASRPQQGTRVIVEVER